jgi:hypothetical protein
MERRIMFARSGKAQSDLLRNRSALKAGAINLRIVSVTPFDARRLTLARPASLSGFFEQDAGLEIWGKRIALLREIMPTASRIGVLGTKALWEGSVGQAIREGLRRSSMSQAGSLLHGPFQPSEYQRVFESLDQTECKL